MCHVVSRHAFSRRVANALKQVCIAQLSSEFPTVAKSANQVQRIRFHTTSLVEGCPASCNVSVTCKWSSVSQIARKPLSNAGLASWLLFFTFDHEEQISREMEFFRVPVPASSFPKSGRFQISTCGQSLDENYDDDNPSLPRFGRGALWAPAWFQHEGMKI